MTLDQVTQNIKTTKATLDTFTARLADLKTENDKVQQQISEQQNGLASAKAAYKQALKDAGDLLAATSAGVDA